MHALVCPLCRIALAPTDQVCPRDGHEGREVSWLGVPHALSQRFLALEPFAHGESGSLYIADDPETGHRGLLKVLTPVAKEQHAERQRLRRELVKQATLARNHLLVPYASGDAEGSTWVFREWLDGVSLEVRLSREGSLLQTEALAIAAQIATALDELHRGGLLHRDVKPGHVFLQPTGHGLPRVLLLDAGIASAIPLRSGPPVFGTPGYVAPEQLLGNLVSFRSDLYALGCVLYRMLTGRPAFGGDTDTERLDAQRAGVLPSIPTTLPPGIRQLLQSLLAREPQERPFSAQKLRRTLEPFLPDGALTEKQATAEFEAVPQARAPGTLRPLPPTTDRVSASGTMLGPSRHASSPVLSADSPLLDDSTHQLDLSQIEEELEARSRPPPTPLSGGSSPVSDKTQPIRLDQILAVADGRRGTSRPPALVEPPRDAEPEPEPLLAHLPPASETRVPAGIGETPELSSMFGDPSGHGTLRGIVTEAPPGGSEQPLEAHSVQRPTMHAKRTLVGLGAVDLTQPVPADEDASRHEAHDAAASSFAPPLASPSSPRQPSEEPAYGVTPQPEPTPDAALPLPPAPAAQARQRDIETEPVGLSTARATAERRRLLMYASAGLVALAVLGVGVSALLSGDPEQPEVRREVAQPPPLPVVTEVQPEPEPAAPREEAADPAPAAITQPTSQPSLRRAPVVAPAPAKRRAPAKPQRVAKKPARPAKRVAAKPSKAPPVNEAVPEKTGDDKAALFAEAREEARVAYAAKRFKDAAAAYERAARYDPNHAGTYAGLGAARLQLGDDKGAVQAYQRAVQLSPTTAGFHAALGRAYLAGGDQARARSAYKQALAIDPNNEAAKAALQKL